MRFLRGTAEPEGALPGRVPAIVVNQLLDRQFCEFFRSKPSQVAYPKNLAFIRILNGFESEYLLRKVVESGPRLFGAKPSMRTSWFFR